MGVFARLLRRSKAAEEASAAEVPDGTLTAVTEAGTDSDSGTDVTATGSGAGATADAAAGSGGVAESADTVKPTRSAEPAGSAEPAEAADVHGPSAIPSAGENADGNDESSEAAVPATVAAGATPSDDVEIPQQQTAEKAADNGAGESARK
ncbi:MULTISPECIES: hypothetical protein [unclassified Streptomyces]|uniref:hypothetical protein n=1 Tax=unclassified Streptomyces TaxID=2593676 RepID=UPI002E318716|nr:MULTISPECIES: hypothetical protein [unclassified Streptomyces]